MPGTNAGTGQPLFLKCSQCKLSRNHMGYANAGDLHRTGRERQKRTGGVRSGLVVYECWCKTCGHTGWYRHKQAARLPLKPYLRAAP